jgi:hypothetical protein
VIERGGARQIDASGHLRAGDRLPVGARQRGDFERADAGRHHLRKERRLALALDLFDATHQRFAAAIFALVLAVGRDALNDKVHLIGEAVGEAERDVAIAAHDNGGNAGHRAAKHDVIVVGNDDLGLVPDRRQTRRLEVRVVDELHLARGAARGRDGPVVRAETLGGRDRREKVEHVGQEGSVEHELANGVARLAVERGDVRKDRGEQALRDALAHRLHNKELDDALHVGEIEQTHDVERGDRVGDRPRLGHKLNGPEFNRTKRIAKRAIDAIDVSVQ